MKKISEMTDTELDQARFEAMIALALTEPPGPANVERLQQLIAILEDARRAATDEERNQEAMQALGIKS
jgi:hypothetical protein